VGPIQAVSYHSYLPSKNCGKSIGKLQLVGIDKTSHFELFCQRGLPEQMAGYAPFLVLTVMLSYN